MNYDRQRRGVLPGRSRLTTGRPSGQSLHTTALRNEERLWQAAAEGNFVFSPPLRTPLRTVHDAARHEASAPAAPGFRTSVTGSSRF